MAVQKPTKSTAGMSGIQDLAYGHLTGKRTILCNKTCVVQNVLLTIMHKREIKTKTNPPSNALTYRDVKTRGLV